MRNFELDWATREYIDSGSYGSVWSVMDTANSERVAVKLSAQCMQDYYDKLQSWSELGITPPGYAYVERADVPDYVFQDECPLHSKVERNRWSYGGYCRCDHGTINMLVMALLDKVGHTPTAGDIETVMNKIRENGLYFRDSHDGNFGYYKGKPVAIDVGRDLA